MKFCTHIFPMTVSLLKEDVQYNIASPPDLSGVQNAWNALVALQSCQACCAGNTRPRLSHLWPSSCDSAHSLPSVVYEMRSYKEHSAN